MNDLLQLMHDTMSPVCSIKSAVSLMKGTELTKEEIAFLLDNINKKADELQEALDIYYKSEKLKKS